MFVYYFLLVLVLERVQQAFTQFGLFSTRVSRSIMLKTSQRVRQLTLKKEERIRVRTRVLQLQALELGSCPSDFFLK